jgi:hypothetical protein
MWKKFKALWDKLESLHRKKWLENQSLHRKMMGEE